MYCRKLHGFGQARLRLPMARDFADRGLSFMLLEATSSMTDEVLTLRALLLAAAYRLHCRLRRSEGSLDEETLKRAMDQAVKETALGHKGAMRRLDSIWITTSTPSPSAREAAE